MKPLFVTCFACSRALPATQFPGSKLHTRKANEPILCVHCDDLPRLDIAKMVYETVTRNMRAQYETAAGRRDLKRQAKLEQYSETGKRCLDCHEHKPVADYDNCARNRDGLQHSCRRCKKLYLTLRAQGGLELWRITRQAMRDKATLSANKNI